MPIYTVGVFSVAVGRSDRARDGESRPDKARRSKFTAARSRSPNRYQQSELVVDVHEHERGRGHGSLGRRRVRGQRAPQLTRRRRRREPTVTATLRPSSLLQFPAVSPPPTNVFRPHGLQATDDETKLLGAAMRDRWHRLPSWINSFFL